MEATATPSTPTPEKKSYAGKVITGIIIVALGYFGYNYVSSLDNKKVDTKADSLKSITIAMAKDSAKNALIIKADTSRVAKSDSSKVVAKKDSTKAKAKTK